MGYNFVYPTSALYARGLENNGMAKAGILLCLLVVLLTTAAQPVRAQLVGEQPDPLARIRQAAKTNVTACSATGETLCEQVAPKIIANAQGGSKIEEDLRRLREILNSGVAGDEAAAQAATWGVAAFQDAGIEVHTERFSPRDGRLPERENVVAEIRGREKPDEWVIVVADLTPRANGTGIFGNDCDAATVIEAARDIAGTGVLPRRSIRFALFAGAIDGMSGSWAYVRSHNAELDRARGAITMRVGCFTMGGYKLNGRHDIEPGLREAMKPIQSFGADTFKYDALMESENLNFLLEGIPALSAVNASETVNGLPALKHGNHSPDQIPRDVEDLKRNTAIVAVTAFGIAERSQPIGPRQSRSQIESLLKTTGLEQELKGSDIWMQWESGQRGRLP